MKKPGEELKECRGALSQQAFGKKIGASQAQVSRLEAGDTPPTLEQAIAIKRVAGIDVERWPWDGAMAVFLKQKRRAS